MIKYFNEVVAELQSKGTIFGAEYRKKNGEVTKINGRFGVSKFVKGTGTSNPNVLVPVPFTNLDTPNRPLILEYPSS